MTRGQGFDRRAEGTSSGFMVYRIAFVTVLLVFDLEGYGCCLLELLQADSLLQELLVVPEFDIAKSKGYGACNCRFWRFWGYHPKVYCGNITVLCCGKMKIIIYKPRIDTLWCSLTLFSIFLNVMSIMS